MKFSQASLTSSIIATAVASPLSFARHEPRPGIQWSPCGFSSTDQLNNTVPILCGTLPVPLDYSNNSKNATINLPLLKLPAASNSTKKESILMNFGGPGINGTTSLVALGSQLQGIVGRDRDFITWFPRGTQGDLLFSCYESDQTRAIGSNGLALANASNVAYGQLWASAQIFGERCAEVQPQNGSLIGTAFSARDAMQIVDALAEDGLIRYWGFSYGTVLGATIAAMFPDRIGKLVIDGVVNAHDYYHGTVLSSRQDSEYGIKGFAAGCVATPSRCPLAKNRTEQQIYDFVFNLIDEVKASPAVFSAPVLLGGGFAIDYSIVQAQIYSQIYSPEYWDDLATLLEAFAARDTAYMLQFAQNLTKAPPEVDSEALPGIQCGDTDARADDLEEGISYIDRFKNNRFYDVDSVNAMRCARWPFAAKERYSGHFQVKTRNPLLVVGNTWDPATPLASARNMSMGFEGSALLEQHGYGHCSSAQASLCTTRRIRNYFNDGTLPEAGTVCQVDEPLFPEDHGNSVWAHVLNELANGHDNGTTIS